MDVKFRQVAGLPDPLEPGTLYFVDLGAGRAALYVTDANGQITARRIVGLEGGSAPGDPTSGAPPTDVTRTGALTSTQTYGSLASVRQRFRPTVNIPVTGVQVDQITVSGNAAVAFHDLTTGTWVGAAAAVQVGAGITAPLNALLLAGHEYFLHVGTLGSGINGTDYPGYVSGVTLSSGHTWTGLSLTAPPTVFESATPVTAGAQLAFQLLTGDMGGFDPSGVTHRAEGAATVEYDADTRTYTHGVSLDLSQWGQDAADGQTEAWAGTGATTYSGSNRVRFEFTALAALTLSALAFPSPLGSYPGGTLAASVTVNGVTHPLTIEGGVLTPTAPLSIPSGATWSLLIEFAGGYPLWTDQPAGSVTAGGLVRYDTTFAESMGELSEVVAGNRRAPNLTFHLGAPSVYGVLPAAAFPGLGALEAQVADHAARITNLEGQPALSAEYVQDVVGSMIPGATYDDAAGTLTLPAGSSADPETIRDIVAAFAVAGSNVTITHNDAGDTLTITAAGGGGGISGPVRLAADPGTTVVVSPSPLPGSTPDWGGAAFGQFTPTADFLLTGIRWRSEANGNALIAEVWDDATQSLLRASPAVTIAGGTGDGKFSEPLLLMAGSAYRIGSRSPSNTPARSTQTQPTYAGFTGPPLMHYTGQPGSNSLFPQSTFNGYYVMFDLLTATGAAPKGTIGPSFTVGSTAARPAAPEVGDQHYDTTLGKPVWWSGSAWKDATGTNA